MSDTSKLSKNQRKKLRKAEKRKASESPEEDLSGHSGKSVLDESGITRKSSVRKRLDSNDYYTDSERYVQSVLNNTPPPIMYTQYGYQSPQPGQPPPNVFPSTAPSTMAPAQHLAPPPWAIQIIDDMKIIKSGLQKIEIIEKSVKNVELSMSTIENKVSNLQTKVNDIETTTTFISSEFEQQKNDLKRTTKEIEDLKQKCNNMTRTMNKQTEENEKITDKLLDLEARSMRDNLMFYGIQEEENENCETLVKSLISSKLELETANMELDRAHRIGGNRAKKPRPIVVKFHQYSDREAVRTKSMEEAVKADLQRSNQGVGIQLPQQHREARKALYDFAREERSKGNQTRVTGNKLFVNNQLTKKYVNGSVTEC